MPIPGKKCLPLPASPYAVDHLHRHKIHSSTSPLSRGVPKTRNIPPAAGHKPAGSHKSVRCPWLRAWNAFNEGSSSSKTTQCETLRLVLRCATGLLLSIGLSRFGSGTSFSAVRATPSAVAASGSLKPQGSAPDSVELDYGAKLEEWRSRVVRGSLRSPTFYILLGAFVSLLIALLVLWHESRERERREIVASEFLAQYHNAWVHATRQAQDAITRHNQLREKLNRAQETAGTVSSSALLANSETKPETSASSTIFLKSSLRPQSALAPRADAAGGAKSRAGRPRENQADLIAQIGILQEQLRVTAERERALERELGRSDRLESKAREREAPAPAPSVAIESKRASSQLSIAAKTE